MTDTLPEIIQSEDTLNDVIARPRPVLTEFIRTLNSPLLILGAGGKMGPSLAVLASRAAKAAGNHLEVVAVSRFSDEPMRRWLVTQGVTTIACDLMNHAALAKLPESSNVIYLVGLKFGTTNNPAKTWAINTLVPAHVGERYPGARIAALSTGGVYPLVPVQGGGSDESDPLIPVGEYANSCVARERIFEYYAQLNGTPITLIRLSYAVDLRYGVLVDIARKVYTGQPVSVTMGYLPFIWQGDANEMIIRSLALAGTPPAVLNLTGPKPLSVREVALRFGELMQRPVDFIGTEAETALLSNTGRLTASLGQPPTPLDTLVRWTAHWIMTNGRLLDKPTHFEVRDGAY